MSVVVGVLTGVLSSFAVWWWLARRIRPRITICENLALFTGASGQPNTQFRIRNDGRRVAHDINISVTARLPSLIRQGVTESAYVEARYVVVLPPGRSLRFALRLSNSPALTGYYLQWLPEGLRQRHEATGRIPAHEFLEALPDASLRVGVFATDAYSKAREYFEHEFTHSDLRRGRFVGATCEIAPEPTVVTPREVAAPTRTDTRRNQVRTRSTIAVLCFLAGIGAARRTQSRARRP